MIRLDRDHIHNPAEGIAVAAMAGVTIDLWEGLSTDIGYRYAQLGFFENDEGQMKHSVYQTMMRLQRHDFRMGLRYAF